MQTLTDADGVGWTLSLRSSGGTDRIAAPVSRTLHRGVDPLGDELSAYHHVEQAPAIALGKKVRDDRPQ
jgi:hypothetical protein